MMPTYLLAILLLQHSLTGVKGANLSQVHVYANVDGDVILPCGHTSHRLQCSWRFCTSNCLKDILLVRDGVIQQESESSDRTSISSDCLLRLSPLQSRDAGIYFCYPNGREGTVLNVHLSLLAVSTPSPLSQLKPGGRLSLGCVLHTFHDPWNCHPHSTSRPFLLGWGLGEQGSPLPHDPRFVTLNFPCNVTLLVTLPEEGAEGAGLEMTWRCQVTSLKEIPVVESFLDVSAIFLLHGPKPALNATAERCTLIWDHLVPASRMLLFCMAQLAIVGATVYLGCKLIRGRNSPRITAGV